MSTPHRAFETIRVVLPVLTGSIVFSATPFALLMRDPPRSVFARPH